MKNISLSQEVKTIVRGMVSNAAKFKLEGLTTFLLFDSMMSQKQFSSLIAKYSSCNLEGIINLIENIYKNNPFGFNEKEVETIEERDYFISVLKDSDIDNPQNFIFSQWIANVFFFAYILVESDEEQELTLSHLTLALFNNLNDQMLSFFTDIGTNIEQLISQVEYLSLLDSCIEDDSALVIPDSISGCVTILNDNFKNQKSSAILGRDKECKKMSFALHFMWKQVDAVAQTGITVAPCRNTRSKAFTGREFLKFHIRAVFQKKRNNFFIFFRSKCAGGIKKLSTRTQHICGLKNKFFLDDRQLMGFLWCPVSGKSFFFTKHAFTRAGSIQKNLVEKLREAFCQTSRGFISYKCIGDTK